MKRFTSQAGSFGNAMASLGSDSVKKATNLTGGVLGKQPSSSEATPKPPPPTQLSQRDINRPARILSLDGGGVRGYSTLIILKRFMLNLQANSPSKQKILPADYFDLIIGTSTGGIIALMLGRLRMSIDDAIIAYQELSKKIFSGGIASAVLGGNLLSSENPGLGLGLGIVKGRELDQYLNMAKTSAFASDTAMYDAARLETYLKETIGKQGYTISNQEALLEEDSNTLRDLKNLQSAPCLLKPREHFREQDWDS
ncbi:hypothetical protein BN14_11431 [Rhizoctonia solani AG-1 IB]|uniref:PNPLA domain-containing protein n=1 Tax=Thanatephorus cucumeris (strain AG1-IB / isolate 7/3/14) TaxID=1108050 RepID=M5CCV2_THACB|nr:hypothetical protein BN14_11431 [Rhizoctonia solani AG-1 IB]